MAAMLAGAMMVEFLGEDRAAQEDRGPLCLRVLEEQHDVTPDLGGDGTTARVTDAVLAAMGGGD